MLRTWPESAGGGDGSRGCPVKADGGAGPREGDVIPRWGEAGGGHVT